MPLRLRVESDELASAVAWAARSLPARPPVAVLGGIRLDATAGSLSLSGFDYEVSNESTVVATDVTPGSALVSGRLLAEIARSLPSGPVEFSADAGRATVRCGPVRFGLPLMPLEDYPVLPTMPAVAGRLAGEAFATAVAQVAAATARDDTLPMLTGIHVEFTAESVVLTSTDRYRLAVREVAWTPARPGTAASVLAPGRMLADTARALARSPWVTLALGVGEDGAPGVIGIEAVERRTTGRLLDATFPQHASRWPTAFGATVDVDSQALATAVKRVCLVAGPRTPVLLSFENALLRVSAGLASEEDAEEAVPTDMSGTPVALGFTPAYLLDGLRSAGPERVRLWLTSPGKPVVITAAPSAPETEPAGALPTAPNGFRYLVMSLRTP